MAIHATQSMTVSIVVPCYNEKENIPLILERFSQVIGERLIEVLLVDNGSTDGSSSVLDALLPNYPFASCVSVPINKGYGFGIVSGLRQAKGDFIGWTHADMQTDPKDVSRAYDILIQEGNQNVYLKGIRKKRPIIDQFFTIGMSIYETVYLGTPLWDINAQPNLFPKSFFDSLKLFPDDFSLDLYMYYMARDRALTIKRFDVLFTERIHGQSKWNDQTFKAKQKFIKRTLEFSKGVKHGIYKP
jgi:glycosyltransferase involved in cell wall biosynthesis